MNLFIISINSFIRVATLRPTSRHCCLDWVPTNMLGSCSQQQQQPRELRSLDERKLFINNDRPHKSELNSHCEKQSIRVSMRWQKERGSKKAGQGNQEITTLLWAFLFLQGHLPILEEMSDSWRLKFSSTFDSFPELKKRQRQGLERLEGAASLSKGRLGQPFLCDESP